jgi:hypothetical protein
MPATLESTFRREMVLRWLLAVGCFALLVYFFSPPWSLFRAWSRAPELGGMLDLRRGGSVLQQEAHPGLRLSDPLHGAIQWRLLFPVVGHIFSLPPTILFGLADLGVIFTLAFILTVLRRRGVPFFDACLAAVILGAGSWYFASVRWLGYYDSWLVLALLVVAFGRARWTVWLACLWAPWVDERFVLAVPLAFLCRWLMRPRDGEPAPLAAFWRRELAGPAGLIVVFMVVRLGWLPRYSVRHGHRISRRPESARHAVDPAGAGNLGGAARGMGLGGGGDLAPCPKTRAGGDLGRGGSRAGGGGFGYRPGFQSLHDAGSAGCPVGGVARL